MSYSMYVMHVGSSQIYAQNFAQRIFPNFLQFVLSVFPLCLHYRVATFLTIILEHFNQ